ncbi:hypothetical protein C8Q76DRAFT_146550 [Earliella scabrosa]|nr:hypothetical protein C8Q76DRAFT_146550 [Earliella scabrosa]
MHTLTASGRAMPVRKCRPGRPVARPHSSNPVRTRSVPPLTRICTVDVVICTHPYPRPSIPAMIVLPASKVKNAAESRRTPTSRLSDTCLKMAAVETAMNGHKSLVPLRVGRCTRSYTCVSEDYVRL